MRTVVIVSTLVLVISLPAAAYRGQARPYVGLNLQLNNPTGDFGDEELLPGNGAAQPGAGLELDIGMASPQFSAYLGFRGAQYDTDPSPPDPDYSAEWTTNRLVIGIRGHLLSERGSDILPTLGGGLTVGRTELKETFFDPGGGYIIEQHSETSIGWFLEGGILAYLSPAVALNANLQYHNFPAEFDPVQVGGAGDFTISHVTLQLGVNVFLTDLYDRRRR